MLERIPGIQDVLNAGQGRGNRAERGFGSSGDQILINGKRISAKSNSIRDILARTTASQVEKVELIRGAADGLDVQTEGLVINVSLSEDADTSSIFWKVGGIYMIGENTSPEFETSYQNSGNKFDYTIALEGNKRHGYFLRDEVFYDENNIRTGEKDMDGEFRYRQIKLNTNLSYQFDRGDLLNINGLYRPSRIQNEQLHVETGDDAETLFWDFEESFLEWEVGGDYTTKLGLLGQLKSRFVINRKANSDNGTTRFDGVGNARYAYVNEFIDFGIDEDIFRSSLTKNIASNMSLEFGGEGAFNTFRQKFDNFERDSAAEEFELTTSNNIVIKENRYEIFAHHNYTISPKMVLQTSLTTEFSKITADTLLPSGDITKENSFTFLKPRVNFRYDFTDRDQLRLVAEKKVSQLEFFHYLTYFDQQTKELKFGNNDIRPEQIWEFSAAFEHRLANDAGNFELEAFYRDYKDYIARTDFTEYQNEIGGAISADQFFALPPSTALRDDIDFTSKPGNIDHANAYGLKIQSTLRLGFLGLSDAQFNVSYELERRRYFDPISQRTRNFSWVYDHETKISFRHDVTDLAFSYGAEAKFGSAFGHADLKYDWQFSGQNEFEIFLEKQIFGEIKARIELSQEDGTDGRSTFYRFKDHVRFNEPNGRDEQIHGRPYELEVSLSGTF